MSPTRLPLLALFLHAGLLVPLPAVEIVAHRGSSHEAPENTLAAFRLGWDQNADADELDIHLSKDGKIVVLHDPTTKRLFGVDKKVVAQTFDELRALDGGSWKHEKWKGEKIPTLDEVLAILPEGKRLFIEVKCGPEVLPELVRVLRASGRKPAQLVIIAFDHPTITQAKALLPELEMYWLASPEKESKGRLPAVATLIEKAKQAGVDGLDLSQKFPLDENFVSEIRKAGLKLHVWTVNDAAAGRKLAALGVDGITTDRPGWLREQISKEAPATAAKDQKAAQ